MVGNTVTDNTPYFPWLAYVWRVTIFGVEFEQPLRADTVLLGNRQFVRVVIQADRRSLSA